MPAKLSSISLNAVARLYLFLRFYSIVKYLYGDTMSNCNSLNLEL